MTTTSTADLIQQILKTRWQETVTAKTQHYIGAFFDMFSLRHGIYAKVQGNHGIYRVSIFPEKSHPEATCSCYIGKDGYCHHCEALAHTFLLNPLAFTIIPEQHIADIIGATIPEQINTATRSAALADIVEELERNGIRVKDVAESMGLSAQRFRAMIKRERQQGIVDDLTPIKLACVWLFHQFHTTQK